jgi:hypothetical protein
MDDPDFITSTSPSYGSNTRTLPTPALSPAVEPDDIHNRNNPLKISYQQVPTAGRPGAFMEDVGHNLGLGARDVAQGVASLPLTLADAATWPGRATVRALGGSADAPSTMFDKALDYVGLPQPVTPGEKFRSEVARGGASMLTPMAPSGIAARFPDAARAVGNWFSPGGPVATGVGGTLSSVANKVGEYARPLVTSGPVTSGPMAGAQVAAGAVGGGVGDAVAESGLTPEWAKPTARLLGNLAGAGATNVATGLAGTARNAWTGVQNETAEALRRLGIIPRTMGAVSQNPAVHETEAAFSGVPMASGQLQPAQRQTVERFGDVVDRTARNIENQTGPAYTTAQGAGRRVQEALHDWRENVWPAEQTAIWEPLGQRMAGASVDPSNLRAALQRGARDPNLASLPETQRAFIQTRLQTWLDALNADVPRGQNMSWEQAMALKRRIGDEMGRPDITSDVGGQALKNIYGSIAGDMRTTAAQHGQAGMFDAANAQTIAGHQFINGTVSKAVRANNLAQETIRPDDAAGRLLSDNVALQQLRQRVPEAADALASYNLRNMATAKPSSQGDVSTGSFLTNLRKQQQQDPEGHAALYTDPAAAQDVRDLGTVAGQFREVEKNMNASKTGKTGLIIGAGGAAGAGYAHSGIPGALAVLGSTLASPYLAGKLLTNPDMIRLAATRPGPRPPMDYKAAGLLGYLANQ